MSWTRTIQMVGLSHHTAPVAVRESLAFSRKQLPEALAGLRRMDGVEEAVILSTCNRVEVYVCARDLGDTELIPRFLCEFHGVERASLNGSLHRHEGFEAVGHLFEVAGGLDSMVLGEAQITAQVKEAYRVASEEDAVGRVLHRAFQQSLSVAKRVRSSSDIAEGRASVGSVAVQLAQRIFETLQGRTVLLVGAGKMGEVVLRSLCAAGAETTMVANRTLSRAEALAHDYGGTAVNFGRLAESLARADVVISSTDAPHYVMDRDDVGAALKTRRGRPLFLIDIAVPRDIEPAVAEMEGSYLYNMDDLQAVVNETMSRRRREVNRCLAIIEKEAREFMRWLRGLDAGPTIAELRESLNELKRRELSDLMSRLPDLPDATRQAIEKMADRLVNKVLHRPITAMRDPEAGEHSRHVLTAARRLFGLESRIPETVPSKRRGE